MKRLVMRGFWLPLALLAAPLSAQTHPAVVTDPPRDEAHPAAMHAFAIPVGDEWMNAVFYTASGPGPHPTLLLLHGFPGNEKNLDLAQAARRAGWNVLTLNYRGSWGSPGAFSFGGAAADARTALAFLRRPETIAAYRIDPERLAVAGHSWGGFTASHAAAGDPRVMGLFLIDAWNPSSTAKLLADPQRRGEWLSGAAESARPLAGTSPEKLAAEIVANSAALDTNAEVARLGQRPVMVLGAARGDAEGARSIAAAAEAAGVPVTLAIWPTDHSFSDHRIALADALVRWLDRIAPPAS